MSNKNDLFIGIDGGATSADLILIDYEGNAIERSQTKSCNKNNIGFKQATKNIFDGIQLLLSISKKDIKNISGICLSTAGITVNDDKILWNDSIKKWLKSNGNTNDNIKIETHNDTIGIIASISPIKLKGIVAIVGTGFIVSGFNGDPNIEFRCAGYGPLLGDMASGYSIGESILRSAGTYYDIYCRKGVDEIDSKTDENNSNSDDIKDDTWKAQMLKECQGSKYLYDKVMGKTKLQKFDDIIDWAYNNKDNYMRVASMVPIIFEDDSDNDKVCNIILDRAVNFLVNRCLIMINKLYPKTTFFDNKEAIHVICGGSIITKQNKFRNRFIKSLKFKMGGDGRQTFLNIINTKLPQNGAAQYIRHKYQK